MTACIMHFENCGITSCINITLHNTPVNKSNFIIESFLDVIFRSTAIIPEHTDGHGLASVFKMALHQKALFEAR